MSTYMCGTYIVSVVFANDIYNIHQQSFICDLRESIDWKCWVSFVTTATEIHKIQISILIMM